jgi:protein-S-isoprenylcysteine O-methyltransferase Ste14
VRATLIGLSGYIWGMLHDVAARRRAARVKPLLLVLTGASHIFAWYRLMAHSPRLRVPRLLRAAALLVAPAGFALMFYSIMVEIPFRKAWIDRGHPDELVTTGTYALARHPGVLWYSIGVVAAALATRSRRLLYGAPVLVAGDVLHVWFQERYVLEQEFGDAYREYQRSTPMIVPNAISLRRFVRAIAAHDGPEPAATAELTT